MKRCLNWILIGLALSIVGCDRSTGKVMYYVNCLHCRVDYTVNDSLRTEHVKNGFILTWHPLHEQEFSIVVDSVDSGAPSQLAVIVNGNRVHTQECDSGATCALGYVGEFTYK